MTTGDNWLERFHEEQEKPLRDAVERLAEREREIQARENELAALALAAHQRDERRVKRERAMIGLTVATVVLSLAAVVIALVALAK